MKIGSTTLRVILVCAVGMLLAVAALAAPQQTGQLQVAQMKVTPAVEKPMDLNALSERVRTLEKENLVMREDLGKARLDARTEMNTAMKAQAEKIAQLNAQLDAEHKARKKQTRNLWYAIGGLAIGLLVAK